MYKAIIFDYGNTLVGSASLAKALVEVLDSPNALVIGEAIEKAIGDLYKPDQEVQPDWKELWASCFALKAEVFHEPLGIMHLKAFTQMNEPYNYTIPLLTDLKSTGLKLALLSNATGPTQVFQDDLEERQLAQYFDCIAWSCEIGFRKPSIKAFQKVLDSLGLKPSEVLMIGDSAIADVEGARAAGIDCLHIVDEISDKPSSATYTANRANLHQILMTIIRAV